MSEFKDVPYSAFPNIDLTTQSLDTTSKNDIIRRKLEYEEFPFPKQPIEIVEEDIIDVPARDNGDIFTEHSGVEQITHDVPIAKDTEEHETRDMSRNETINFIKRLKSSIATIESEAMKAAADLGYEWNSLSGSERLAARINILKLNDPLIDAIKIASTQVKKNKLNRIFQDDAQYEKFTGDSTKFIAKYNILRSLDI